MMTSAFDEPCLDPLGYKTHAALPFVVAVPPVVLFVFTQLLVAALKFSLISVTAVLELEVAEEVKLTDPPAQTLLALDDAVTADGAAFTVVAVALVADAALHPLASA